MDLESVRQNLMANRDSTYAAFMTRLIPNIAPETILGVRTPKLRHIVRGMEEESWFLDCLPHDFFEENQIHALLLSRRKDFDEVISRVEAFLPYVDNWATCDQIRPRVFVKNHKRLWPYLEMWISDPEPYTVRFGVEMLMCHFLDGDFTTDCLDMVASIQSEEYYVKMMIAWYFATALSKQYAHTLPYLEKGRLPLWIHNKTIQKAVESYRIDRDRKQILKRLRR